MTSGWPRLRCNALRKTRLSVQSLDIFALSQMRAIPGFVRLLSKSASCRRQQLSRADMARGIDLLDASEDTMTREHLDAVR